MDPQLSQLDHPASAKLGVSAADTQLSRSQGPSPAFHPPSSFRQSFLSAKEVQSSFPTTHVNNKTAAALRSQTTTPATVSSIVARYLGAGSACVGCLHCYTKDSNLFLSALIIFVCFFVGLSAIEAIFLFRQSDRSKIWGWGVDLSLLVTATTMLAHFTAVVSHRWVVVASLIGLGYTALVFGLSVARKTTTQGLIYRSTVSLWLFALTLPIIRGSINPYDSFTDKVYGLLIITFEVGALLQFVFGFGVILFLNIRQNGLNKRPKSLLVAAWTMLEVILLSFVAVGAAFLRKFGNMVLFWSGNFRPWVEEEEALEFAIYLGMGSIALAVIGGVSAIYWNEMTNLTLKLQADTQDFVRFLGELFEGAFGFIAERSRARALRTKLKDIRQVLKETSASIDVCAFCNESPIDVVFDPCKHATYCFNCFQGIRAFDRNCPRCSKTVRLAVVLSYDNRLGEFRADRIMEIKAT
jgi:hypothetical protein